MVLASIPDDADWNAKRKAVDFSAGLDCARAVGHIQVNQ